MPLNLSPFTQITLHTLSQTQSIRASRRSRWRPGWGQRAGAQLYGWRTENGKQLSADVLESCVCRSPKSCGCLRGRPRDRPHRSLAARGFSVVRAARAFSDVSRAPAPAPRSQQVPPRRVRPVVTPAPRLAPSQGQKLGDDRDRTSAPCPRRAEARARSLPAVADPVTLRWAEVLDEVEVVPSEDGACATPRCAAGRSWRCS